MAKLMGFRTLAYFGDHFEQSLSGIGTSDRMVRERPDTVKRVLRGTLKSLRYVQQNPADVSRYIEREWKVDPAGGGGALSIDAAGLFEGRRDG